MAALLYLIYMGKKECAWRHDRQACSVKQWKNETAAMLDCVSMQKHVHDVSMPKMCNLSTAGNSSLF